MSQKKQWIVVTSGDRPIEEISEALEKKGFTVESTLDAIGQIIGSATEAVKEEAAKVKGISAIQSSGDINIGPPDADITW